MGSQRICRKNQIEILIPECCTKDASEIALVENLQREDLNAIEETEGILELLALRLQSSREEVISVVIEESDLVKADNVDLMVENNCNQLQGSFDFNELCRFHAVNIEYAF